MIICDYNKCTGCGACADICPQKCIEMNCDNVSYMPKINDSECINCLLCQKVCQVNNPVVLNKNIKCYASWSDKERATSSSGGMAAVISQSIIMDDGNVIGCVLDKNVVKHELIDKNEDLYKLKGSKYTQSITEGVFKRLEKALAKGKVCFIGTPCQIAGVKNYVKTKKIADENLILIDLICHGVPSQKYISDIIKRQSGIELTAFRHNGEFKLIYDKKPNRKVAKESEMYILGFLHGLFYRDSCYGCPYAQSDRGGDITLGDFWEISDMTDDDIDKGISVTLVNTAKGEALVAKLKDVYLEERDYAEAIAGNGQLSRPSSKHSNYNLFKENVSAKGFCKSVAMSLKRERFVYKVKKIVYSNAFTTAIVKKLKQYR